MGRDSADTWNHMSWIDLTCMIVVDILRHNKQESMSIEDANYGGWKKSRLVYQ